jgi:AcrR family transcriptional regulator
MMDRQIGVESKDAPRRRNDPAGVRARILDASFMLFQSQGYAATSVHQVASGANVTGGALHHHFPTKKALGLAVIRERVAPALEETWLAPVRSAACPSEDILKVFDSLARALDTQGSVRGCPVNNLSLELAFADPDYRAELRALFDNWRSTIAQAFADRPNADALATLVVGAYSGAMAMAKVEQRGEPLRLCARELRKLL